MPRRVPSAFDTASPSAMPAILDRVVLVDVEVARRSDRQIEAAMPRDQIQHVVEEANARLDVVPPVALDAEAHLDPGLARAAVD